MILRMMLIAASWPSNSEAAVTILILFLGVYGKACSMMHPNWEGKGIKRGCRSLRC